MSVSATIERLQWPSGDESLLVRLEEAEGNNSQGRRLVHSVQWDVTGQGADHAAEELEAACWRLGFDDVQVDTDSIT